MKVKSYPKDFSIRSNMLKDCLRIASTHVSYLYSLGAEGQYLTNTSPLSSQLLNVDLMVFNYLIVIVSDRIIWSGMYFFIVCD